MFEPMNDFFKPILGLGLSEDQFHPGQIFDQPGLSPLREAVKNRADAVEQSFRGQSIRRDALAGLTAAVGTVPDGMAEGVLVGVNPLFGLYANIIAPIVGALFVSTPRMVVS